LDLVSDHPRDANSTGLGQRLKACRDIHPVAEDVVFLDDHVAQIDPDAEPDAPILAHFRLAVDHAALDLHGAAYRIDDTWKFREQPVAGVFHGAAMVLCDLRIDQLV